MLTSSLPSIDYSDLVVADPPEPDSLTRTMRIALIADAATQQFVPVLKTLLARAGIRGEIYEGGFGAIEIEAYNPASDLYRFDPEVVIVLNCVQALRAHFGARKGSPAEFVDQTLARITAVWNQLHTHSRAVIVQSTFALPAERTFGNLDLKVPQSFYSVVSAVNLQIAVAARERSGVLLNDVEFVASWLGRKSFFDDRYWDMWKSFCAIEHLPSVAQNIVDILVAQSGRAVKCIICDLDNTLWGGVIGDEGVNGIRLNAHGDGEAYYRLQLFLRELRRRGVLLAVCSKNEESNAKAPFLEHPDCVLKLSDFASFVANWKDKAHNIRRIQQELNLGFDSLVFIDDNPFERNLVRDTVPDVLVPELPDDPSEYVRFLSELNLFETTSFSAEDLERSEMYTREAERRQAAAEYASVEEFMRSLEMVLEMARFDDFHLPRVSQLFQRSNQFNLTTRRHSEAACAAMMRAPELYPIYAKLSDRLGDHGLIGVVVLELTDGELAIRDWLMSCRVLARGVEQQMMNQVFLLARKLNASRITGQYIPTAKNGMVRDFFPKFGFRQDAKEGGEPGTTYWQLDPTQYVEQPTFITAVMNLEEMECPSITTK
jgi:FkbH-like protein